MPLDIALAGWDFLVTVPATTDPIYEVVVPTLTDLGGPGYAPATFMVRARTAVAGIFYDSPSGVGTSIDNLPPAPPGPFTAAYAGGATHLHWGVNAEPDLWHYRVYKGSSAAFVPGPANLISSQSDTGYTAAGAAGSYYKLSAVDINGNESAFSLLTPSGTTAVGDQGPLEFSLQGVRPNPSRSDRANVWFTLATEAPARLELLDVSGRMIAVRELGSLGAGTHMVDLAEGHRLARGLYLVRLTQGTNVRVSRAAVVD